MLFREKIGNISIALFLKFITLYFHLFSTIYSIYSKNFTKFEQNFYNYCRWLLENMNNKLHVNVYFNI